MPFTAFHHNIAKKISVAAVAVCCTSWLSSTLSAETCPVLDAHATHSCYSYGVCSKTNGGTGGLAGARWVMHVDKNGTNAAPAERRYRYCTSGTYYRITTPCSDYPNNCVGTTNYYTTSGDGITNAPYHVEYRGDCEFACVGDTSDGKPCNFAYNGIRKTDGTDQIYGVSDLSDFPDGVQGTMFYGTQNGATGNSYCREGQGCFAWKTTGCYLKKEDHPFGNCERGTLTWRAENASGGNAFWGFYIDFKLWSDRFNYVCSRCNMGYVLTPSDTFGDDCSCNTAGHWNCPQSGEPSCYYGYIQNGTGSSAICVQRANFECGGDDHNTCYCKSGYNPIGCTDCKTNFRSDGQGNCVCDTSIYTWNQDSENPENDTCDIRTDVDYTDSTGTFRLSNSSDSVCDAENPWWQSSSGQ